MKHYYVVTGGTMVHVAPHFSLCAPAYGTVGDGIWKHMLCQIEPEKFFAVHAVNTRMTGFMIDEHVQAICAEAGLKPLPPEDGRSPIETNEDLSKVIDVLIAREDTKVIIMAAAICDWEPFTAFHTRERDRTFRSKFGKDQSRLKTDDGNLLLEMKPADKIVKRIRQKRKDIFLVAFKTTTGATESVQYAKGLHLLKGASANLVLANDLHTKVNMIITPEEARYHVTTDREHAIKNLVEMTLLRSHLTFTRSTVVDGSPVPWDSAEVPRSLRTVVEYCVQRGAYKPFRGATVGHFACKLDDTTFLTSRRKTNFNDIAKLGLVKIKTDGPDTVLAFGARPSVGGQSQRIVFKDHPGMDCIVHFHCPLKPGSKVPVVSQREYECGSHECGKNTSSGLGEFIDSSTDGTHVFKAVFLDQHGPNIVFNSDIHPQAIIDFIEANFDLEGKTGGLIPSAT